jgi:Restriction endonuclease
MSKHHERIKNDPRWKAARAECLERDDHACVWCGSEDQLEADHVLEVGAYPELAFEVENLRTLCKTCHIKRGREASAGQGITRLEWVNERYRDVLASIL